MRRALGLADGTAPTARPRPEQPRRRAEAPSPDRPSGARPRQRFVQDGEVPVTVVNRQHEPDAPARPSVNRLGGTDAALANEQAARRQAERSLQQALAAIHDLRTKLGHADLARQEAVEAARTEREAAEALRAAFQKQESGLAEALAAERAARMAAESALHKALAARGRTEEGRQAALEMRSASAPRDAAAPAPREPAAAVPRKTRKPATPKQREPQPVKWWLGTSGKR